MDELAQEQLERVLDIYAGELDAEGMALAARYDEALEAGDGRPVGGPMAAMLFAMHESGAFDAVANIIENVQKATLSADWQDGISVGPWGFAALDQKRETWVLLEAARILVIRLGTLCNEIVAAA